VYFKVFRQAQVASSVEKPKFNKVKILLPFLKLMKCPQTQSHAHTTRESQVTRSKKVKSKFIVGWNFSCTTVYFSLSIFL